MKSPRSFLILTLAIMAGINFYLDHQENRISINTAILIVVCSIATALPSLISFVIARKTKFSIGNLNPYSASADLILSGSLFIWLYLLFAHDRPHFYEGASHMYVVTWPLIIGLFVILLYALCLFIQSLCWVTSKHNKGG